MKRFILDALITLFFSAVLIVLCYQFLYRDGSFLNKGDYIAKHEYMEKHASAIKTLLLGHSHFEVGINPYALGDSVYDLAINARVIYYDKELLRKYLPSMTNLKTVIYPMHYSFLNACQFYSNKRSREEVMLYYKTLFGIDIPPDQKLTYWLHFIKVFNYRICSPTPIVSDSLGFVRLSGQDMVNSEYLYKLWTTQICRDDFTNTLEEMANLCELYNVRFIVITCPFMDTVLSYTTSEGIRAMYDVIDSVKAKYPIEYHNYIDDSQFRADSLYQDESHLNYMGATLFAQRVKEDFGL